MEGAGAKHRGGCTLRLMNLILTCDSQNSSARKATATGAISMNICGKGDTMDDMRAEYDFSKSRPNPYAKKLKRQKTINIDKTPSLRLCHQEKATKKIIGETEKN